MKRKTAAIVSALLAALIVLHAAPAARADTGTEESEAVCAVPEDVQRDVPENVPGETLPEAAPDVQEESAPPAEGSSPEEHENLAGDEPVVPAEDTPDPDAQVSAPAPGPEETISARMPLAAAEAPDAQPDSGYILVEKRFEGIAPGQIPVDFALTVTGGGGETRLDAANALYADSGVLRWRIDGAQAGEYVIREHNAEVEGYSRAGDGTMTVAVTAGRFTVSSFKETTCSHQNWPVAVTGDRNVMFAAALTGGGCVVVSQSPLSASQRATVAEAVTALGGNWKAPVNFYSIEANGNGPWSINGKALEYHPQKNEIFLHRTSNWTHVAQLEYSVSEGSNPDINLVNRYTPLTASVRIEKQVTGSMGDKSRVFGFAVTCDQPLSPGEGYELDGDGLCARFSLRHGESVTLRGVRTGSVLTVTENGAEGYRRRVLCMGEETDGVCPVPIGTEEAMITVINHKDAVPDTGIRLDGGPAAPVLCLSALFLLWRRRERSAP